MNQIEKQINGNVIQFTQIVSESNSIGDILKKYKFSENGKYSKQIKEYIDQYKLNIDHFGLINKSIKYKFIDKECPVCKNKFTTQENHPREKFTCSCKCSNIHFSSKRHTEESDNKISKSLAVYYDLKGRKIPKLKVCKVCLMEFVPHDINSTYCSNKCCRSDAKNNPIYIEKLRQAQLKRIANGTHSGWKSRNIISYPEQFFMKVLKNNNIDYIHNKPTNGYFLDFAIENKMIDLEIDGKQHKFQDRIDSDKKRDEILINNGWKVYRIEWNCINTEYGKTKMKEKIDKFLEFYKII